MAEPPADPGEGTNCRRHILQALQARRREFQSRVGGFIRRRLNREGSVQDSATATETLALESASPASLAEQPATSARRFPGNPLLRERAEQMSRSRQQQSAARGDIASTSGASPSDQTSGPVCAVEVAKGRQRIYLSSKDGVLFEIQDEKVHRSDWLRDLYSSYLLPSGYPQSVAPEYSHYMAWRGVQYFFGGAISVFTTRSLLGALGVNSRGANEASAAINWVLKDGAGRMGRFLFARWGRQLDCELKQFRLGGDILMEAGAALELSTIYLPRAFLPLACTANLAKNLAGVAASATRAPIYRTFALQNNMADITAKGESVANLADILGTFFGIGLARTKWPVLPCFAGLSMGYLYASRREVDTVVLPYLNRARLAYTARRYLEQGKVPDVLEANQKEPLLPWREGQMDLVLGARVEDACVGPQQLLTAIKQFKGLPYAITYRPDKRRVMIMLEESASPHDLLQAAFHGHYVLHRINSRGLSGESAVQAIAESVKAAPREFRDFEKKAARVGWNVRSTMLNAGDNRLRLSEPK